MADCRGHYLIQSKPLMRGENHQNVLKGGSRVACLRAAPKFALN
jgi:hypothetical protein